MFRWETVAAGPGGTAEPSSWIIVADDPDTVSPLIAALDALHDHYNPAVKNRVDTTATHVAGMSHRSGRAPGEPPT